MLSGVEYVRSVCLQRGLAVSVLEKDLGFSNGYLNPKKLKKIPYDRAMAISDYLQIPLEPILGKETEKTPTSKGERTVSDDDIKFALFGGGSEISDAMYQEVLNFADYVKQREAAKKDKKG